MDRGLFGTFNYDTWLSTPPEFYQPKKEDEDRAYDEWKDNVSMGYDV